MYVQALMKDWKFQKFKFLEPVKNNNLEFDHGNFILFLHSIPQLCVKCFYNMKT